MNSKYSNLFQQLLCIKILSKILLVVFYLAVAFFICAGLTSLLSLLGGQYSADEIIFGLSLIATAIILIVVFKKTTKKRINFLAIILSIFIIFIVSVFISVPSPAPLAAFDAKIETYFDDLRTESSSYRNINKDRYIGLDKNSGYLNIREKIDSLYEGKRVKNYYSDQIREDAFCAKDKLFTKDVYWCIDSRNGYAGTTTDQYCTPEKPYCVE